MRLNKYLAQGGVASRREADRLIQEATTTVNGILIVDPAFNVEDNDVIIFNGKRIHLEKKTIVYVMNKPKGYITTARDPQGRKTVTDLFPPKPRLFSIGRLDRNSTGVLLLTNDGSLAQSLMLPKNRVSRIYKVEIDRALTPQEIKKVRNGIHIGYNQRGKGKVLGQVTHKKRTVVQLELLQGKNREIRRIMAVLGRNIFSLHRTCYGSIELKDLKIGKYRKLTSPEIKQLQKAGFR